MGLHTNTVFKNSCLKVPVNPCSRLPSAKYERNTSSILSTKKEISDSVSSETGEEPKNQISFSEFLKSIPDYEDVTHMSNREFYLKLESLRDNKNKLLLKCGQKVSETTEKYISKEENVQLEKYISIGSNTPVRRTIETSDFITNKKTEKDLINKYKNYDHISDGDSLASLENNSKDKTPGKSRHLSTPYPSSFLKRSSDDLNHKQKSNECLVSWDNKRISTPMQHDSRYKDDIYLSSLKNSPFDPYKKCYSLPTSPVKRRRIDSEKLYATTPSSFKVTYRDDDKPSFSYLKEYANDLENKFLKKKDDQKQFRANPVPIESRIPLYDKIMEDQELRRSICKLQSTAELQAQMKPFKFTEREERRGNLTSSYRLCRSNPQLATLGSPTPDDGTSKHFRAKPVPKNLFSNYIYDKMREDDFYRALNRRIRAEEMLKASSLPPSMAKRETKKKDVSKCSVTTRDFLGQSSSTSSSSNSSNKSKKRKGKKRSNRESDLRQKRINDEYEQLKREFIRSGSPRKSQISSNRELLTKAYASQSSLAQSSGHQNRTQSAVDVPSINRSNLAAILRIESTKRKMEADVMKILEEERYQSEVKWRDSVLRRKPAWNTLKYRQSDDLELRLQTRRDEERVRREQFLHDMEMMYGRVHRQPLMFERSYGPKRYIQNQRQQSPTRDTSSKSSKPRSALMNRNDTPNTNSPNRSRKVSINETAETIGNDIDDILYHSNGEDDRDSDVSDIPESIENYRANEILSGTK